MGHRVAKQVLKRRGHALQHAAVNVHRAAGDVKLDLFACLFGGLPHHTIKALGNTLKFHHARAQQVTLQLTRLSALGNQIVLCAFDRALQIALNGGHVVNRFSHHSREFLHAREAVKLQRVKRLRRVFGQGQARLHLGFRLKLNVAKLGAKLFKVSGQIDQ